MPPRGPHQKNNAARDPIADGPHRSSATGESTSTPPPAPTFKMWLEEHWHGWMKPVGGILGALGGYFLYTTHVVPEFYAGVLIVIVILAGAILPTTLEAFERVTLPNQRYMLGGFVALWALCAGYPTLRAAIPGKSIAEVHLAADKTHLSEKLTVPDGNKGPYELEVSGILKGSGDAESNYTLNVTGEDGSSQEVEGSIKRTWARERTSRRGSATEAVKLEHNEDRHRLTRVHGPGLTIAVDGADEQLEDGLNVIFHPAGIPPIAMFLAGFLLLLVGFVLDYKFVDQKRTRTHFSTAAAFTLVFAIYYPLFATRNSLVRPAIGGLVAALAAAMVAWLLSAVVNSFHARPKKLAGVKV